MDLLQLEAFQSSTERPDDFDQFWADVLAQVERIPLNPSIERIALRSTEDVDVYEVHYDSLDGVRIAGWYCLPVERPERLPAVLAVPGYISDPAIPKALARQGYAAFSAAPRGKVRSNSQYNPGYPGLLTHNIIDRNTYSYRGFYTDAVRAFDFLVNQPEIDADRIGVRGSSQGGGLTLVVAALRPDQVRVAAAGVPYLCSFMDAIELTHTYPYEEICDYLRLHPDNEEAVQETLAYFDGVNFGPRITCPIIVNVGLQDNVCPPETGYAAYRTIASADKQFYPYDGHGHDGGSIEHNAIIEAFFAKHLQPAKQS
jgi:cephalosporin-C deacetylase